MESITLTLVQYKQITSKRKLNIQIESINEIPQLISKAIDNEDSAWDKIEYSDEILIPEGIDIIYFKELEGIIPMSENMALAAQFYDFDGE